MPWEPPVVDMTDPSAAAVIRQACEEAGFFYIENHGIPPELTGDVFRHSKAFFDLEIEEKMALEADENNRGYTPMHEQKLDPANQSKGDTKEGYYIYADIDADSDEATKLFRGPNKWPSEALLPGWKVTMKEYFASMEALGARLVALLASGIGLSPTFFDGIFSKSYSALRLLHYSAEVSDSGGGVYGAGAHTDFGLITMLATDAVPGLQVRLDDQWLNVPPRPNAFVCNLGDLLQRWTNDCYKSTMHRVVNKEGRERYSVPFFLDPDFDTKVECLPQFCSADDPAKYPPITSGEHLLSRLKQAQTHLTSSAAADRGTTTSTPEAK